MQFVEACACTSRNTTCILEVSAPQPIRELAVLVQHRLWLHVLTHSSSFHVALSKSTQRIGQCTILIYTVHVTFVLHVFICISSAHVATLKKSVQDKYQSILYSVLVFF